VAILATTAATGERQRPNDLGVRTAEDCALVLIDYQNEMLEVIRSKTPADLVELHVRISPRIARAYGMPIVLSTMGVKLGFNGPTLPSVLAELDGIVCVTTGTRGSMGRAAALTFAITVGTRGTPGAACARGAHRKRSLRDPHPLVSDSVARLRGARCRY
jgi:hypothetical protein